MNHVFTIEQVFADRIFTVPDYQRGYAWEEQNWRDFLEDLELLPEGKEHYTGTLVLHPRPDRARLTDEEGKTYGHYDVVDGQQRLTTIVVLLDVIARALKELPDRTVLAAGTRKTYVAVRDGGGQPAYRLRLDRELQPWFTQSVLADVPSPAAPNTAAQERLFEARKYFAGYLETQQRYQKRRYEAWLLDLREKITRRLKLSVYEVGDSAEVGVIFEVMNNRGKPLTELEKVKNYILYLSTRITVPADVLREETNAAWATIFRNLMGARLVGPEHEDRLLRAHWIMAYDHDVRNWEGSRSVKKYFNLKKYDSLPKTLLDDLLKYVRTLRDASVAYCDVFAPRAPAAFSMFGDARTVAEVRAVSEKLLRLWVTAPFVPALIAARLRAPQDGARYLELARLCELFSFRVYRWGEWRSHTAQSTLFRLAHEYYKGRVELSALIESMRGCLLHYSPEDRFAAELQEQPRDEDNDWYEWSGLRYLLYEYEEHCAGKETVRIAWSAVAGADLAKTVEHILPQSPTEPYWKKRFNAAQLRRYTHDIGNLCLTSHNLELSNKPFDRKRGSPSDKEPCYANSLLASERELAAVAEWNPAALLARRKRITDWARERWRVAGTATPVAVEPDEAPTRDEAGA